jgi:hypothetical protein
MEQEVERPFINWQAEAQLHIAVDSVGQHFPVHF